MMDKLLLLLLEWILGPIQLFLSLVDVVDIDPNRDGRSLLQLKPPDNENARADDVATSNRANDEVLDMNRWADVRRGILAVGVVADLSRAANTMVKIKSSCKMI